MTAIDATTSELPAADRRRFVNVVGRHRRRYWLAVGLFSVLMLGSVVLTLVDPAGNERSAERLGFPLFIVEYPLAAAKLAGLVAIILRPTRTLVLFAYAGFLYDLVLALLAHVNADDFPQGWLAVVGLVLWTGAFVAESAEEKRMRSVVADAR